MIIDLSSLDFATIHQAAYYLMSHIGLGGIVDVSYGGMVTFLNGTIVQAVI